MRKTAKKLKKGIAMRWMNAKGNAITHTANNNAICKSIDAIKKKGLSKYTQT